MQTATAAKTPAKPTTLPNGILKKALAKASKAKAETPVQSIATAVPKTAVGFDYNQITSTKTRTKAQAIAKRIKANIHTMEKNLLANGRELTAIKEDLGHGLFGTWVDQEFHWSKRSAENYMAVADRLADDYHHLTYLPAPTIYRLAAKSIPEETRFQVVNAAKDNKPMSKEEVERAIKIAKGKDVGEGGEGDGTGDAIDTDEARRAAAVDAMAWLQEQDGYSIFLARVRDAGNEFFKALKDAVKEAA